MGDHNCDVSVSSGLSGSLRVPRLAVSCHYVTVDVFSDFFEVDHIGERASTKKLIWASKQHFSRYGIPVELHSDNGPQFASEEYNQFLSAWNVTHVTSSPYFAQSNGKAEAAVKVAKRLLKKCLLTAEDYHYGLLEIRNVPQHEGVSRAKKFFGRHLRSRLPLKLDQKAVRTKLQFERNKTKMLTRKKIVSQGARSLKPLTKGDVVCVEPLDRHGRWRQGICHSEVAPRSYLVRLTDGTVIRRNIKQLKLSKKSVSNTGMTPETSQLPISDPASLVDQRLPSPIPSTSRHQTSEPAPMDISLDKTISNTEPPKAGVRRKSLNVSLRKDDTPGRKRPTLRIPDPGSLCRTSRPKKQIERMDL